MRYPLLILCLFSQLTYAQLYDLSINLDPPADSKLKKELLEFELKAKDSIEISKQLNAVKSYLFDQGYFLSSGKLKFLGNKARLTINTGKTFIWAEPKINHPENFPIVFSQSNKLNQSALNAENINSFCQSYLRRLENNGYPFAQIQFSEYKIFDDTITGEINIVPGPYITIDSIAVKGFDNFSKNILRFNLLFKKGMPYSEAYLQKLSDYVGQIEFLSFDRSPAIAFSKDKTILYLYMKEVKSNQVDGVVGLNTLDDGSVSLNGDFQLRLLNIFKKGEELKVRWRRPDESISDLNLYFDLPYLFNSPFGIQGDLQIFRQDSSFVNTNANGLLKYLIEGGTFLSFGIGYVSSNVLLSGSAASLNSFTTVSYKLGFERRAVNNVLSPTKGNDLSAEIFTGQRTSSDQVLDQYGWSLKDAHYFPLYKRNILKAQIFSQSLIGDNLFENEVYRIGGLKTLRGFNEQSIYASSFAIGTLEYRYMLSEDNYLASFADLAWVDNQPSGTSNTFIGLGAGINFRTNGGIFSFFYAVGRDNANSFDFRTSKIHFGYINRF